ncbi:MAG: hypothetical protein RRA92_03420 [Gemmatimonadota bacterium]|nr:hypothetical protein [Gemmatimonadota bacterium]
MSIARRLPAPGALLPGLLLAAAAPATAQVTHEPGETRVVTVGVPLAGSAVAPLADAAASISYEIFPAARVRPAGPVQGQFAWEAGDERILPVTLSFPADLPAGERVVARVQVTAPGGVADTLDVATFVPRLRRLRIEAVPGDGTAPRGRTARVTVRVRNAGNAPDTVGLVADAPRQLATDAAAPVLVLAPGDSATTDIRFRVARDAEPGRRLRVRVSAEDEPSAGATASLVVVEPRGLFSGLVHVPATLFLGNTFRDGIPGGASGDLLASLAGRGEVAAGTEVEFAFRRLPAGGSSFAFGPEPFGPRAFVAVRRDGLEALGGEMAAATSALLGSTRQAVGGRLQADVSGWSSEVVVAAPRRGGAGVPGHLGILRVARDLPGARLGLRVEDVEQGSRFAPEAGTGVTVGLATAEWRSGTGHVAALEAGWMRLRDAATGRVRSGPAADLRYSLRQGSGSLDLHARTVPAVARTGDVPGRRLHGSAVVPLLPGIAGLASGYLESDPSLAAGEDRRRSGADGGVRFLFGRASLDLLGRTRTNRGGRPDEVDARERTAFAGLALPLGPVFLDGSAELGRATRREVEEPLRRMRVGGLWNHRDGWVRAAVRRDERPGQPSAAAIEFGAGLRTGRLARLSANLTAPLGDGPDDEASPTVQVAAEVDALPGTAVFAGVESYSSAAQGGRDWAVSLGVRRRLSLAVPIAAPEPLSGVAFLDLDGDGARTADEPLAPDVHLRSGVEETVTDSLGRFRFHTPGGRSGITVDAASLAAGQLAPEAPLRPASAHVGVPIAVAASLVVELFLDEDGDGRLDPGEPLAVDVPVLLVNEPGAAWSFRTDAAGRFTVRSLRPGTYEILVPPGDLPARAMPPAPVPVHLTGGAAGRVRVPVPTRRVRFRADAGEPDGMEF